MVREVEKYKSIDNLRKEVKSIKTWTFKLKENSTIVIW